jgi:hypothetical protein
MAPSLATKLRLTKRAVDGLEPADKDQVFFDAELPGFGVKVTPAGRKCSWYSTATHRDGKARTDAIPSELTAKVSPPIRLAALLSR